MRSPEIYLPSSNTSCTLTAELPEGREYHTQTGGWACGEADIRREDVSTTCDHWSQGSWIRSDNFNVTRHYHVSWATASGVYIIGGSSNYGGKTSELVKEDGSVEEGFKLKYYTK